MGWIAIERVARARMEYGRFKSNEWQAFLDQCGLHHMTWDLGTSLPAILCDEDTIVTDNELAEHETAWWVWHEVAHHLLHGGDRNFWRSRPQGDIILSKFERQADEFASAYPEWE